MNCIRFDRMKQSWPYPEERPDVPNRVHGWRVHLKQMLPLLPSEDPSRPCVVVEVGSWCGRTTLALLGARPDVRMVCIDHWQGSREHQKGQAHWQPFLPILYETFIRNTWDYRERIGTMRAGSRAGLWLARNFLYCDEVALIYVDGCHMEKVVFADIVDALAFWPDAVVCGDDWGNPQVERAVQRACFEQALNVVPDGMFWHLETG